MDVIGPGRSPTGAGFPPPLLHAASAIAITIDRYNFDKFTDISSHVPVPRHMQMFLNVVRWLRSAEPAAARLQSLLRISEPEHRAAGPTLDGASQLKLPVYLGHGVRIDMEPLRKFANRGELISRLSSDVTLVRAGLTNSVANVLGQSVTFAGSLVLTSPNAEITGELSSDDRCATSSNHAGSF